MKKILNYLKFTMALFFISGILLSTHMITAQAEDETGRETANLDVVSGSAVRMARTSTGVVVDGYQLNHDYVKILNINNGNIVINDESYTQGSFSESWSTQADAYVIKGTGTSANNITINPTSNEITVYLVDLEWNGQLIVGGNGCNVNVVICGNVKNLNASCFINIQRYYGNVLVTGLADKKSNVSSNIFFYQVFPNPYYSYIYTRIMNIKGITINTNYLYSKVNNNITYDNLLTLDNVVLNNKLGINCYAFQTIKIDNSTIQLLDIAAPSLLSISNSNIGSISVASPSLSVTNSEIGNISATGTNLSTNNSFLNYSCPVTGVINSTNTTLNLNSGSASSLSKINLNNCSLFSAVKFVGTPVDSSANDLFVKKIRLRQFPNTYVWLSIDNGTEARLKTDSNGYLYPYVKKGTTRVDARLEDGQKFYATFPPTTGADNTTTNLLQTVESVPVIVSYSDTQRKNIGETFSLYVNATPGTAGKNLSYQWYKNDIKLTGETQNTLTRNEAITTDNGIYKCIVKEDGGSTATSGNIEVIISRPTPSTTPVLLSQSSDMRLTAGDSVTLIVTAIPSVATNTLSYQWYQNNIPINFTSDRLTLSTIGAEHAGSYKCVITEENFNTTVESAIVNILVR